MVMLACQLRLLEAVSAPIAMTIPKVPKTGVTAGRARTAQANVEPGWTVERGGSHPPCHSPQQFNLAEPLSGPLCRSLFSECRDRGVGDVGVRSVGAMEACGGVLTPAEVAAAKGLKLVCSSTAAVEAVRPCKL